MHFIMHDIFNQKALPSIPRTSLVHQRKLFGLFSNMCEKINPPPLFRWTRVNPAPWPHFGATTSTAELICVSGEHCGRLRLSYASNSRNPNANRTSKITWSRDLFDIDKQGQSPRPLPEAIAVWRGFTRVTTSLAVTANRERRRLLHKKLIKHYTTQSFKYGLKSRHSMNYKSRPRR